MTFLALVGGVCLLSTALGQVLSGQAGEALRKVGVDIRGLIEMIDRNI